MRACVHSVVLVLLMGFAPQAGAAEGGAGDPLERLSTECQKAFAAYKRKAFPMFFAVTQDGAGCAYSFCESACRKSNARHTALYRCETLTDGRVPCEIFAVTTRIVWEPPPLAEEPKSPRAPATRPGPRVIIKCHRPDGTVIRMTPEGCAAVGGKEAG